jgi:hypothetical protein
MRELLNENPKKSVVTAGEITDVSRRICNFRTVILYDYTATNRMNREGKLFLKYCQEKWLNGILVFGTLGDVFEKGVPNAQFKSKER